MLKRNTSKFNLLKKEKAQSTLKSAAQKMQQYIDKVEDNTNGIKNHLDTVDGDGQLAKSFDEDAHHSDDYNYAKKDSLDVYDEVELTRLEELSKEYRETVENFREYQKEFYNGQDVVADEDQNDDTDKKLSSTIKIRLLDELSVAVATCDFLNLTLDM